MLKNSSSFRWSDRQFGLAAATAAILSACVVVLIALFLVKESAPVLARVGLWRFITDTGWFPIEKLFGLTPMLVGSVLVSAGALAIAVPAGLAIAAFSTSYATARIARMTRGLVAILAGVPSVIFGFWGLTVLVPIIARWQAPGASLLAGALVLALMILPTIALTSEAALASIPSHYAMGAAALGLSREAAIVKVMLPAARTGIGAGILLAAARALGETMAILMVAGNVVQIPKSVFDPVRTLTANIALEMAYATGDHRSALFVSGLVLTALAAALALLAWRMTADQLHG